VAINDQTEIALRYHDGTKHPDGSLMDRFHAFDPSHQPLLHKTYLGVDTVPLSLNEQRLDAPALEAIAEALPPERNAVDPSLEDISTILHLSAGIIRRITRHWGEYSFRAAACTGALYHIELYIVCADLPGLRAGVYHYDVAESSLDRLRNGDFRGDLADACGGRLSVAEAPVSIVYTDVVWRNAVKYQAREYRHAFWDSGTIIANTLAVCSGLGVAAEVVAGFVDGAVSHLVDADMERELPVAVVPVGRGSAAPPPRAGRPLGFETVPIDEDHPTIPAITKMHSASALDSPQQVAQWQRAHLDDPETPHESPSVPLDPGAMLQSPVLGLQRVIERRGSARQFSREAIGFAQLSTVLATATRGVEADYSGGGSVLWRAFLIVNAVDGLTPGAYAFDRDATGLKLLREGDFRREAGSLGLGQALPADSAVNIYLMADLPAVLKRYGNRGYRAAQLDSAITAGKLYLAAYAQRFGATGLTFFDDAVTEFFSPEAAGLSGMFLMALGHRQRSVPPS
jgi:SagB-type dehydrogenase family enzyme